MFQNRKKWFLLVQWVAKIKKKRGMKNPEAVITQPNTHPTVLANQSVSAGK